MSDNKQADKSVLDSLFDAADSGLDAFEAATGFKKGNWKIDEIIDNDTGQESYTVTNGVKMFSTTSRSDAEWLMGVLQS